MRRSLKQVQKIATKSRQFSGASKNVASSKKTSTNKSSQKDSMHIKQKSDKMNSGKGEMSTKLNTSKGKGNNGNDIIKSEREKDVPVKNYFMPLIP